MNIKILEYIKTLSNEKNVQKLLFETIGYILLEQNDFEKNIKENENKIIHIRDWITSVIENNEKWKKPRVLTLNALNNTADKYFEKKNNKLVTIKLNENDEKLIADLGEYYVVQMLTPEALDNESKIMQHCIGHGWYDNKLLYNNYQYLSLRDRFNKAHVTLEIYQNNIVQLQGKQNKIPEDRYLEKILPWLQQNKYKNIHWEDIGKYFEDGKWISFKDIKIEENIDYIEIYNKNNYRALELKNDKYLYMNKEDKEDKKVVYVKKNEEEVIIVCDNNRNLDIKIDFLNYLKDNYQNIKYSLFDCILNKSDNNIYSIYNMPDNCEIDDDIISWSRNIKKLPDNMIVNGSIILRNCPELLEMPNNMIVNGNLDLSYSKIKKLYSNLKVEKDIILNFSDIEKINENVVVNDNLVLFNCKKLIKISDNLKVKGSLNLNGCDNLEELPDNCEIGKNLIIKNSGLKRLPDNLCCKHIEADFNQINLLKESMNFDSVLIGSIDIYTKKTFFQKFSENKIAFYKKK